MSSIRRRAAAAAAAAAAAVASSKELPGSSDGQDTRRHRTPQQQVRWLQFFLVSTTCLLLFAAPAAVLYCARTYTAQQQQQQQQGFLAGLGYSSSSSDSWAVSQVASTTAPDGTTYGPSLGIFPHGCKWRDVSNPNSSDVSYEYWVPAATAAAATTAAGLGESPGAAGVWSKQQPAACRLQASTVSGTPPAPVVWHKGNPRTEVVPSPHHVTYRNLWYNNGRWYALVDSDKVVPSWKFSKNHEVTTLHVRDARTWLNTTRWRLVPGDTLLFDFIFFTHPTAIGHWWELLGPLFSVLKSGAASGFRRPCDRMVLLHLKRAHLMEWVRAVMAVGLGVAPHQELPPIWLQQETHHPWQQLTMALEGVAADEWVAFDRVLIVRDLFTGGKRSFTSSSDAREFRAAVYTHYGLPRPSKPWRVPRVITFQRKRANRRILNEPDLLALLSAYGRVLVVEFNASTPFAAQLGVMRDTGVYVSAHTSNLANAVFLQPGSAVVEIIQRHWTWNKMDQSFRDHTTALGDLHHFAWRANHPNETVYHSERDAARFTNWTKGECLIEDCTEAATRVDIVVDLAAFKALLDRVLPRVLRGRSVASTAQPWPEAL